MIKFILKENNKNLIVFVHGFTGGRDTWIDKDKNRIPKFLQENKEIASNFDMCYFEYHTAWSNKIERIKWLFGFFESSKKRFKSNLSIDDIKDIFFSHLKGEFKKYDRVIIIAHSMGGLISKSAILKLIENDNNKIALLLLLAVPNNGSSLANLGKLILNNPNVQDLQPLSKIIDNVTRNWINPKVTKCLPETIYYQGKNDKIVPKTSSNGYEARETEIVYSEDDHGSILTPDNSNTVVIQSITDAVISSLKKKVPSTKALIESEISETSINNIVSKISAKLGMEVPSFENQVLSKDRIPDLAANISKRQATIEDLLSASSRKWIAIYGMYDTGKTQLSSLIHHHLKLDTIWISLKELDEKKIISKLLVSFGANSIEDLDNIVSDLSERKTLIVLDDLPKFGNSESVDNDFNTFISKCLQENIRIISTSNHQLSSRIQAVHHNNVYETPILLLDETECEEVINSYPDSASFKFKSILHTITEGYPIYLQVVCRYLQNVNWVIEEDKLLDFFLGKSFTGLTDETLSKFVSKVEDENTRDLLYRLNIIRTKITDKEITCVAECAPCIYKPFEKVVPVTGTWIQREGADYVISPIFKRLGTYNLSTPLVNEINYQLGELIMAKGMLSQYDVRDAILYFKISKNFEKAGFLVLNFLQYCISKPNYFFDWNFDLFTWYRLMIPEEMSLTLRLFIRGLHLNIEMTRPVENQDNVEFLSNDLVSLVDQALEKKVDVYFPSLLLASYYLRQDSVLAIKYFSYYTNSHTSKQITEIIDTNFGDLSDFSNNFIWLLLYNVEDMESMLKWFDSVQENRDSLKEPEGEQSFVFSRKLFINFITKEQGLQSPDWNKVVEQFGQIFTKARQLNLENLSALAIKHQIMILSEMLDDLLAAEKIYERHRSNFREEKNLFLLGDEIGRQFYYKKENDKAEKYLSKIVEIKVDSYFVSKTDTYLTLAKIIGSSDKHKAHFYMDEGLSFVKENIFVDEISYIQFVGEYATSLYLLGDTKSAIIKFIEGYELLLDSFEDSIIYINTQIKYGNALGYLVYLLEFEAQPGDGFTEPYRGFISNTNDLTELFFPEKLLINIFNIIGFFEIIQDHDKAKYWAFKLLNLKEKHKMKIFHKMLSKLLGYLITDEQYDKAFKLELEVIDKTNELKEFNAEEITNPNEKETVVSIQSNLSQQKQDSDFDLIILVFIPILIHQLKKIIINDIEISEAAKTCTGLLAKYSENFKNKELIEELIYILNHFPNNETESIQLWNHVKEFTDDNFKYLQVLTYVICSLKMNSKIAIDVQFKLAPIFKLYEGSININVINPFLQEYWKKQVSDAPGDFKNPIKLRENLHKTSRFSYALQSQAILVLAAEHLNYNLNDDDQLYVKGYTDVYGE